jgi:hypothetical protein
MSKKGKAMLVSIFMLLFVISFGITVKSDTQNVTTEWVIPGDDSIAVTYPTGQGKILFEPGSKDFTDTPATGQASGTAGVNVDNQGNQALIINGSWSANWETGVDYVNMSINDWGNTTSLSYGSANETVNQTWVASLAQGADEDFWFWTTGTDVAQGTHQTTLEVWSDPA